MSGRAREAAVARGRRLAAALAGGAVLVLGGCAQVPKESVDLPVALARDLAETHRATRALTARSEVLARREAEEPGAYADFTPVIAQVQGLLALAPPDGPAPDTPQARELEPHTPGSGGIVRVKGKNFGPQPGIVQLCLADPSEKGERRSRVVGVPLIKRWTDTEIDLQLPLVKQPDWVISVLVPRASPAPPLAGPGTAETVPMTDASEAPGAPHRNDARERGIAGTGCIESPPSTPSPRTVPASRSR